MHLKIQQQNIGFCRDILSPETETDMQLFWRFFFITGSTGRCQNYNYHCSQWQICRQNDISCYSGSHVIYWTCVNGGALVSYDRG